MGSLLQDLKYGLRIHAKTLGLTTIAVMTLALGIGACTAVFGVVDAILLRPLPYAEAEKIVIPWRLVPSGSALSFDKIPWSASEFQIFLQDSKTLQDVGAFKSQPFTLTGGGEPKLLDGLWASPGFFSVLGVSPVIGRTFTPEEDKPGHEQEVILSYDLWQEHFGGSPHLIGLPLVLNGKAYTVIGVMPPGFSFPRANEMPGSVESPRAAQLWIPLVLTSSATDSNALIVIGRLKPGVSLAAAQSEWDVFSQRLDSEYPNSVGWFHSKVTPLNAQVVGDTRLPLLLMLAAVAAVLLIACSNVASLLLTRSLARRREFTVRAALGAEHHRLIRQVLTESLLLAIAALTLGILMGEAGLYLVKVFGPAKIPRLQEARFDPGVFAFALGITIVTGILFGLAPAVGAVRRNLSESLKEGGQRSGGSLAGSKTRKVLVISQVALALVLVIAAGLVTKTFFRLLSVETGFNAGHVLTFEVSLLDTKYSDKNQIIAFYDKLLQQLQSVSGVKSGGIVDTPPMGLVGDSTAIRIPGRPTPIGSQSPMVSYNIASPGYFSAVGTPLLRGRDFLESDRGDSTPVTIINSSMAKKFWPGQEAVGKQVGLENTDYPLTTIIGIVADVKHTSRREDPAPEMYVPYTQKSWLSMLQMQVVVRTLAAPASVLGDMRAAIHSLDPDLPMAKVATLETLADNSMAQPRFSMLLLGSFGLLSLVLASVGMYGVLSYSVSQRTQEIGIRIALGAQRRDVFRMVLGEGARLAGIGILIGLLSALALTRVMGKALHGILYGVTPTDPVVYGTAVSLLLLSVALLACYVPAWRATRVHPVIALREE